MKSLAVTAILGTAIAVGVLAARDSIITTAMTFYSKLTAKSGVSVQHDMAYGPHARHRMDVYSPKGRQPHGPIVLFLYGGSWRSGNKDMYGFVGSALAARGFTTVIPDYRLFPEVQFPSFVEDAAQAYASITQMPGATRRPVVVMGHSAGAHMAALLALDRAYLENIDPSLPRPAGLIGLAGPYAFDPTTWPSTKDVFALVLNADSARPVSFVDAQAPRALLMHGLADTTVKLYNSRDLRAALERAGVDVQLIELNGIGHLGIMLTIARGFRWRAPVLEKVVAFLDRSNS